MSTKKNNSTRSRGDAEEAQFKKIAQKIADHLFVDGADEPATRLVIELQSKKLGGGWCKQAVVNNITEILLRSPRLRVSALKKS